MYYRFTASKQTIELDSIAKFKENPKGFTVKEEQDFKGLSFYFVWERLSEDKFKLICYYKGIFHLLHDGFKDLAKEYPMMIASTIMYKEFFSLDYYSDKGTAPNIKVSTDFLKFKFTDLFEDEEVMALYISKLITKLGWTLEYTETLDEKLKTYIEE